MLILKKSTEEAFHAPAEAETVGAKAKTPESEGSKGVVKDVARRDAAIVPRNARYRAELENKPQEERTQSSAGALSPGQFEPTLVALLSIGGKTVELLSPERRRSSGGQHYRSDEAALVFRRQSVLLIVAASAVCVIILTLVFTKLRHTDEEIDVACVSDACRQVAAYLASVVDSSVSPCDDFYRYVCGRWQRMSPPPPSFMADVAHNFSETRHAALVRERHRGEAERAASLFYRSCLDFYGRPPDIGAAAASLFKELDISVAAWMKETAPEKFFADVLRLSFVYRFHSLFKITSRTTRNETHYFLNRQPSFAQRTRTDHTNVDTLRQYLRRVLATIGRENLTVLDQVTALDSERSRTLSTEAARQGNLEELNCGIFSGPKWVDVLAQHRVAPQGAFVEAHQFGAICKDLTLVLVDTTSAARPLYLMALLLAHVLRYDDNLAEREDGLRALCLRETAAVFGSTWLPLLTRLLSVSEESQKEIDGYFESMLKGAKEQVLARKWMTRADSVTTANTLDGVELVLFPPGTTAGDQWELCTVRNASLVLTATDFIRNKVALQTRSDDGDQCGNAPGTDVDWTRQLDLLQGTSLVVDSATKTLIVPHVFGVPPLYYPGLVEKYVNLAFLGVALTRHILRVTIATRCNDSSNSSGYLWGEETLARYKKIQKCYATVSSALHGQLLDSQFDAAFLAPDAFELSYSEKSRLDPPSVVTSPPHVRATSALFFKRACLALCKARNDPGEPEEATMHAACLLGVSNVPRFYEIFGCHESDRMMSIRKCLEH